MRGSGDSETKELKESRPFSPLPSTSDDHYTFALNDSLFSSHFEESRRDSSEEHPAEEAQVPQSRPTVIQQPTLSSIDVVAVQTPSSRVVRTPSPHIEIVDSPLAPTNTTPDSSSSNMAVKIEPKQEIMDVNIESDSSDCEIVNVVNGNPESNSYRILEPSQTSTGQSPPDRSNSKIETYLPRSRLRRRSRRLSQTTLSPYSIPEEDDYGHRSIRRPRSAAIALVTMTEIISCLEQTTREFVRSESLEAHEERNGPARIIDTVDLSVDTFKPTPIINEVIVVDSDTSLNIDSETSISSAGSSMAKSRTPVGNSVPEKNCDKSPGAPQLRDCPICLDSFSSSKLVASTFCGHIFCSQCVKTVMKTSRKCPTCRKKLTGKGYHFLFF